MAALFSSPSWLTEVRESFTRGGPWVSLEKFLLWIFSILQYSAAFGRESRKFAGGVWKYAKFRHFLANPVV